MTNAFDNMSDDMVYLYAKDCKKRMEADAESLAYATAVLAARVNHKTGTHALASGSFVVSENNSYDKDAIVAALTPGQVRRVSRLEVKNDIVKLLYPAVHMAAKVTRGVKVTLR